MELALSGDLKCCSIGDTGILACIARGRGSLDEHYLLLIDHVRQNITIKPIHNCYRAVSAITWSEKLGLTFLSYQASGTGDICYKITKINKSGEFFPLLVASDHRTIAGYSGTYVFFCDYDSDSPAIWVHRLSIASSTMQLQMNGGVPLIRKYVIDDGIFTKGKVLLPRISWMNAGEDLLVAYMPNNGGWVGVYDLNNLKLIVQESVDAVTCAAVADKRLLVCCTQGFFSMAL